MSDLQSLTYDLIIISPLKYQVEIAQNLRLVGVNENKILKLDKQYFEEWDEDAVLRGPYFCFDLIKRLGKYIEFKDLSKDEVLGWYRGNYKLRCLYSDQKLSDLLIEELQFTGRMFHIIDRDRLYIGTLTREAVSALNEEQQKANLCLGKLCQCVREMDSTDKSISVHTCLIDIVGLFQCWKEKELAVINDRGMLVDVLEAERFFAHFAEIVFPEKEEPVVGFAYPKIEMLNNRNLNEFSYNEFSQNGEDGILKEIFNRIGFSTKIAVEFGGFDGVYLSNTRRFILENNFLGIFIEGDSERAARGTENYKGWGNVRFIHGYVGFDRHKKLDEYMKEAGIKSNPDIISIDIDGYDYHVWYSFKTYRPRIVVIEFNPTVDNQMFFINPKSEQRLMGTSCSALVYLGLKKGYELVSVTNCNCIFIVEEEFHKLGIKENSLKVLRPRETYLNDYWMQTYDGSIYFTGWNRYIWIGKNMNTNQFKCSDDAIE